METIEKFREYRSKKFSRLGLFLHKLGISANMMTVLSLALGLLAVYFLFTDYYLFILFAVLHLLADGLDGVIARVSKSTKFGSYFDLSTDCLITFLLILKIGWHLQDYYAYIVAGLFFLAVLVHFFSGLKSPIYFMRTAGLIVLAVFTFPLMPAKDTLLIFAYLLAGIFSVYSLAKQLQWFLKRNFRT